MSPLRRLMVVVILLMATFAVGLGLAMLLTSDGTLLPPIDLQAETETTPQ